MKNQKGYATIVSLVILIIFVVGFVGWVKNIIKLSNCDFEKPYKAEIIHSVGLVPVVGAVTGWLDIGK